MKKGRIPYLNFEYIVGEEGLIYKNNIFYLLELGAEVEFG